MMNCAEVWDLLKAGLQTGLTLIRAQIRSWSSLINLTCTDPHQFVVVYNGFVKLVNQPRLHKSTAVNDEIFVCSLPRQNIQVPGLQEYTYRLFLDDETVTARVIKDDIHKKPVTLTSDVSHDCLSLKSRKATVSESERSRKKIKVDDPSSTKPVVSYYRVPHNTNNTCPSWI